MSSTPQRTGLTAAVAPVLAPATGSVTARAELDADQRLHAEICVDGKCYKTSIDLAPAIAAVMARMAAWHAAQHDGSAPPPHLKVSGEIMLDSVDDVVSEARDGLIDALVDRHVSVACAGWLDDIGNAIKGAGSSVLGAVTDTVKKLKGPITAAASAAATAAGGPIGGALASQFVGPVVDEVAGKDTPQKAAIEKAAKTDPAVAQALSHAKQAVAHTVAAYHVRERTKRAASGHPGAQQEITRLLQDAQKGDPAAQSATDVIAQTLVDRAQHSEWGAKLWEQLTGRGPATVSGDDGGVRSYRGVTHGVMQAILNRLADKGMRITTIGPDRWDVDTTEHGVRLRGAWNRQTQVLTIAITDMGFGVGYDDVWSEIDPQLRGLGATAISGWVDVVGAGPWIDLVGGSGYRRGRGGRMYPL